MTFADVPPPAPSLTQTGLKPVKEKFFAVADGVKLDQSRGRDIKNKQYSVLFYGNPGTVCCKEYINVLFYDPRLGMMRGSPGAAPS